MKEGLDGSACLTHQAHIDCFKGWLFGEENGHVGKQRRESHLPPPKFCLYILYVEPVSCSGPSVSEGRSGTAG